MSRSTTNKPHPLNVNLTDTTSRTSFPVVRANNNHVTFSFDTDASRPGLTQLKLPKGSTWTPGPHWHESYTEYLLVKQGRVKVVLDGVSKIVSAEDGPQVVNKFVVHEWMRADLGMPEQEQDETEVVVEEWTDPDDGVKQVFFRNLLGMLGDMDKYWKSYTALQIVLIFSAYDNYVDMLPAAAPKALSYWITHLLFGVVGLVAKVAGLRSWYEAYTPEKLRSVAASPLPITPSGANKVKDL